MSAERVLEVEGLSVDIEVPAGRLHAVTNVDLHVDRGETLCIVGESGCGKTITALAVMRLLPRKARMTARKLTLEGRDLLGIEDLSREEIEWLLERGRFYKPMQHQSVKKLDTLRGKTIVNLFFESSTRTRTSFEIAAKRLGADTVGIQAMGSSLSKGESLVDTLNTLAAMRPDAIVMRHSASGAPQTTPSRLPT